jgi:hypothetical protein
MEASQGPAARSSPRRGRARSGSLRPGVSDSRARGFRPHDESPGRLACMWEWMSRSVSYAPLESADRDAGTSPRVARACSGRRTPATLHRSLTSATAATRPNPSAGAPSPVDRSRAEVEKGRLSAAPRGATGGWKGFVISKWRWNSATRGAEAVGPRWRRASTRVVKYAAQRREFAIRRKFVEETQRREGASQLSESRAVATVPRLDVLARRSPRLSAQHQTRLAAIPGLTPRSCRSSSPKSCRVRAVASQLSETTRGTGACRHADPDPSDRPPSLPLGHVDHGGASRRTIDLQQPDAGLWGGVRRSARKGLKRCLGPLGHSRSSFSLSLSWSLACRQPLL